MPILGQSAGGLLGGVADMLTGGWASYPARMRAYQDHLAQQQALIGQVIPQAGPTNTGPSIPAVDSLLGDTPSSPPATIDLTNPALARLVAMNPKIGGALADLAKAQQPDIRQGTDGIMFDGKSGAQRGRLPSHQVVNGYNVDLGAPNAPSYIPTLPQGTIPDGKGGVINLPGLTDAVSAQEAAKAGAVAQAQAPYDFITTPTPNGAPQVRSKATAVGGVFTGQSPVDAAAATRVAANAAALPGVTANSDQALSVIDQLRTSKALHDRTGVRGVLPAIPGTAGADFDASLAQLKGKLFLEAYGSLKGAGQISEIEGKKATDAMARLNQTQTPAAFKAALDDLYNVISAAKDRASAAASPTTAQARPRISREEAIAELKRRGKWPGGQ